MEIFRGGKKNIGYIKAKIKAWVPKVVTKKYFRNFGVSFLSLNTYL